MSNINEFLAMVNSTYGDISPANQARALAGIPPGASDAGVPQVATSDTSSNASSNAAPIEISEGGVTPPPTVDSNNSPVTPVSEPADAGVQGNADASGVATQSIPVSDQTVATSLTPAMAAVNTSAGIGESPEELANEAAANKITQANAPKTVTFTNPGSAPSPASVSVTAPTPVNGGNGGVNKTTGLLNQSLNASKQAIEGERQLASDTSAAAIPIQQQLIQDTGKAINTAKDLQTWQDQYKRDTLQKMSDIAHEQSTVQGADYWGSRTTAQKVLIGLSIALGGLSTGAGGSSNPGLQLFQSSVNEAINKQKFEYEQKGAAVNTYGQIMDKLKDWNPIAAASATRLLMEQQAGEQFELNAFKRGGQAAGVAAHNAWAAATEKSAMDRGVVQKALGEGAQAYADANLKHVEAEQGKFNLAYQQKQYTQYGIQPPAAMLERYVPGEGMATSKENAEKAQEANGSYQSLKNALVDFQTSLAQPDPLGQNRSAKAAVAAAAAGKYLGIARAAGAPEEVVNNLSEIAKPGFYNNVIRSGRAATQVGAAIESFSRMHQGVMAGYGLNKAGVPGAVPLVPKK